MADWSPARIARFRRAYIRGASFERLGALFGIEPCSVGSTIQRFRRRGIDFPRRPQSSAMRAKAGRIARVKQHDDQLIRTALVPPAVIYTATSQPVALLDPLTRERRAL